MKETDYFLKLLELKPEKPTFSYLEKIVRIHMTRIPFETISKLYYYKSEGLKAIPSFGKYLEGIEKYNFGGTCYSNNYYLSLLLKDLGFNAVLCGADMSKPDVHTAVIVEIESKEYIIDAGYAAPFIKPISRDQNEDQYIESGEDIYIIKPKDADKRTQIEMFRNNKLKHGYILNPAPKSINNFKDVIIDSFSSEAAFLNSVLLTRYKNDTFIRIHNLQLSKIKGKIANTKSISTKDELYNQIFLHFCIPLEVIKTALNNLVFDKDARS